MRAQPAPEAALSTRLARSCWACSPRGPMLDPGDLAILYRRHAPAVFRRARRLLGSDADAHEIVQDIFLSLHERPEQFEGRSSLTTYLYSMTTHACLTRLRNQRNRERLRQDRLEPEAGSGGEPGLDQEELLELRRTLMSLPEDVAKAAVYSLVDGLTHADIARLLDCSRRHVGDLLERLPATALRREATTC